MLGSMGILFFCIYFFAQGIQDLVFPLDNFQFRFLQWIDCKTKERVELVDVEGQSQLSLQKGQGICLDQNYQLPLYEESVYHYTFIFNRNLIEDQVFILIDYKMYNLSLKITDQSFISIQHYHLLNCINSIELWLNSTLSINLIFFYITKVQTNTKNQVLLAGKLPQLDNNKNFYFNFYSSFELIIKNRILFYKAIIQKSQDEYSSFYWFKLYLDNSLLPLSISQMDSNNSLIQGSYNYLPNNHIKLNNLPFLIKTKYKIRQISLLTQIQQTLEFEAIIQIDKTFSQLASENILFKDKFKQTNQVRMLIEVTQIINNTYAVIKVLPKNYNTCVTNIYLSNAKINIKNDKEETILECYLIDNNENESCISYDDDYCMFYIKWKFENNIQYSYELWATLKKKDEIDPFVYFHTDIEYFPILNDQEESNKGYWIVYLILINLLLPILIFLYCVFGILSLKVYHPYIMYIIEMDEIIFQSQRNQQQQSQSQSQQQSQSQSQQQSQSQSQQYSQQQSQSQSLQQIQQEQSQSQSLQQIQQEQSSSDGGISIQQKQN